MKTCFLCGKEADTGTRPGRSEACRHCGADLKVCLNCAFYEKGAYNDCRESSADRVVCKDKANFCEFFEFRDSDPSPGQKKEDPLDKLKSLFKA